MDKIMKNKRSLELVTNCSIGYKQVPKNTFLVMFYLTNVDDLLYNGFYVIPKLMSAYFQAFTNSVRAYMT